MRLLRQFKFVFIEKFYNLKKHLGEKKYISSSNVNEAIKAI